MSTPIVTLHCITPWPMPTSTLGDGTWPMLLRPAAAADSSAMGDWGGDWSLPPNTSGAPLPTLPIKPVIIVRVWFWTATYTVQNGFNFNPGNVAPLRMSGDGLFTLRTGMYVSTTSIPSLTGNYVSPNQYNPASATMLASNKTGYSNMLSFTLSSSVQNGSSVLFYGLMTIGFTPIGTGGNTWTSPTNSTFNVASGTMFSIRTGNAAVSPHYLAYDPFYGERGLSASVSVGAYLYYPPAGHTLPNLSYAFSGIQGTLTASSAASISLKSDITMRPVSLAATAASSARLSGTVGIRGNLNASAFSIQIRLQDASVGISSFLSISVTPTLSRISSVLLLRAVSQGSSAASYCDLRTDSTARLRAHVNVPATAALQDILYPTPQGTHLTIPIQSLPTLSLSERNDVRKVYFALCEAIYNTYTSLAEIDRPLQMTAARDGVDAEPFGGALYRSYNFSFVVDTTGEEIAPEP